MRQAEQFSQSLDLWLIDPAEQAGLGIAYSTSDPRHLLNVTAARMSAFPDDPEHFLRWLTARQPGAAPGDFAPRQEYGRYLIDVLEHTSSSCRRTTLHRVRDRVAAADSRNPGLSLQLAGGGELQVDAAVLALGNFAPSETWADPSLRTSDRFIGDPWAPGALDAVPDDGDVLLVGTGLTMADLAITLARPGRALHAVSRHGLPPREHLTNCAPPVEPPKLDGTRGLDALRRAVRLHLAISRRTCGDWRPGVDGMRSVTSTLWQQLSVDDRIRFLREDLRTWETHRHRMAPGTAALISELRATGALHIGAATVVGASPHPAGLLVHLSDGRTLQVTAVVNCTGPHPDLRRSTDPLVRSLLDRGHARPGPAQLGLDTAPDGRLLPATAPLWTIGALRRGNLLESTAMPEIRTQAAELAAALLGSEVFNFS